LDPSNQSGLEILPVQSFQLFLPHQDQFFLYIRVAQYSLVAQLRQLRQLRQ
jgi:hypothetical protein